MNETYAFHIFLLILIPRFCLFNVLKKYILFQSYIISKLIISNLLIFLFTCILPLCGYDIARLLLRPLRSLLHDINFWRRCRGGNSTIKGLHSKLIFFII